MGHNVNKVDQTNQAYQALNNQPVQQRTNKVAVFACVFFALLLAAATVAATATTGSARCLTVGAALASTVGFFASATFVNKNNNVQGA